MAVPKQVRKQTEAVQALYNDLNDEGTTSPQGEAAPVVAELVTQEPTSADSVDDFVPQPEPVEQGKDGCEVWRNLSPLCRQPPMHPLSPRSLKAS